MGCSGKPPTGKERCESGDSNPDPLRDWILNVFGTVNGFTLLEHKGPTLQRFTSITEN